MPCLGKLVALVVVAGGVTLATTQPPPVTGGPVMRKRVILSATMRTVDAIEPSRSMARSPVPEPVVRHVHPAARVVHRTTCPSDWRATLTPPERTIIFRESTYRTTAYNPSSGAFGLGQLIPLQRERYAKVLHVSSTTTDPCVQVAMFRMYVRARYGTADAALVFWNAHGWY